MRPSARFAILDAAFRLAGRDSGAAPITYEATAREAGITKGGVLYHFPTREDLVLAVTEYVARRCEAAMQELIEVPLTQASPVERIRAYVRVAAGDRLTRADLAVYAEALGDPVFGTPWDEILGPWLSVDEVTDPHQRARLRTARYAADGLWLAEAIGSHDAPTAADRAELLALIETLLESS
jgi:AcrR family transcriptional regulator